LTGDDAREGRGHAGVAKRPLCQTEPRPSRGEPRARELQLGLGGVESRFGSALARVQPPDALRFPLLLGEAGTRLFEAGARVLELELSAFPVDLEDRRSLLDGLTLADEDRRDAAVDLRRDARLVHGKDLAGDQYPIDDPMRRDGRDGDGWP
jgi:hypothetical protein